MLRKVYQLRIPTSVTTGIKKKRVTPLNLNIYRNADKFHLNTMKINYSNVVMPLLKGIPRIDKCFIKYTLFNGTHRLNDVANVCSIVDKFFSDTLTASGILEDDNIKHVLRVSYIYGGYIKDDPHVLVTIIPIQEIPFMKLVISSTDLQEIIRTHLSEMIVVAEDVVVSLTILEDSSVEVTLSKQEVVPVKKTTAKIAPKAVKAVVEPEPEIVEEEALTGSAEPGEQKEEAPKEAPKSLFGHLKK